MSDVKDLRTVADFVKETGLSTPTVVKLLSEVSPEVTIGRTKGYHKDAVKAALINKNLKVLKYLGVVDAALDNLHGHGSPA